MEVVGRRVEGLRAATAIFVGSRIGLVLIALVAMRYFPLNAYNRDHNSAYAIPRSEADRWREPPVAADQAPPPASSHAEPSWIAVWARWDALWYVRIAERGYAGRFGVDDLEGRSGEPPATGFYPLMPFLDAGSRLGGRFAAARGPLDLQRVSARVVVASFPDDAASARRRGRRDRRRAAAAVSTGVLSSAPYSDSLGLALSLGALDLALAGRLGAAGALGLLSALTRPTGVLLAPAIWIQWWQRRRQDPASTSAWGALAGFLPLLGMLAFLGYCGAAFGDPLAPFHRQATWRGAMGWPPAIFQELGNGPWALMASRRSFVELAAAILFVVLGALAFRYLPFSVAAYGLGATLLPLWTSLFSFSRLSLASFPVFMTAGALLRRRPAAARGWEAFFAVVLGLFAVLYFTWNWIG